MPLIPFPDVPTVAGVPPLAGVPITDVLTLLTGDGAGVSTLVADPQWGLFDDSGNAVVLADSVIGFDYAKEYRVSNYPVEEGSFASYNKVEEPYDIRILLAKGGNDGDRAAFISELQAAEASLDLYTVITPDATYVNANVVRTSYGRHASNGVSLIVADVQIEEIRPAASSTFSNTASPAGAAQQSGGTVQPQTPSSAQATAAAGGGH